VPRARLPNPAQAGDLAPVRSPTGSVARIDLAPRAELGATLRGVARADLGRRTSKKFKTDEALGSAQYPDVGPGTMRRLDDLFTGAAPKPATPVLQPGSRPGWQQMNAAVDTYTDPSQQDLIDAIIKLASNKLDALIAELEALGYARLKKK
jgi:hypothetical protein